MDSDSSGFIERCRFCGGKVIEVKKTKTSYFLSQFNHLKRKQCSRCGQTSEVKNIVLSRSNEVLGQI